jgi:HK97 family phage portal protein
MFLSNGAVIPNNLQGAMGDVTPIMGGTQTYYASDAGGSYGGPYWGAYGGIYRSQLWVGIVVRKRAYATARMPFEIQLPTDRGGSVRTLENGPMQELMDSPNQSMSGFDLWHWTSATRDVYGEAFWLKWRDRQGRVRELEPMHPANVSLRRNTETGLIEYVYNVNGSARLDQLPGIPREDVVAFTSYNPDNMHRGVSNLEALRMTLFNEDSARRASASFWQKGGRPSMILTHPNELSEQAQERLKKRAEENHGGADNMGGVVVFEEGITATLTQLTNEEMQYIESRKLNREEVCAAYDISPLVVHILDHATFSNVTEQLRSQYRDTMAPIFTDLQSSINRQLVPDFYPDKEATCRFNMDDVLRGDLEQRSAQAQALRQGGIASGNEARAIVGLDPDDDPNMDKVFANSALQPLGQTPRPLTAGPGTPTPPATGRGLDEDLARLKEQAAKNFLGRRGIRAVMGKLPGKLAKAATPEAKRDALLTATHTALLDYYDALHDEVMDNLGAKAAGAVFDRDIWDSNLKSVLSVLARKTAEAVGTDQAAALGSEFRMEWVEDWLDLNSELGAELFNDATSETLADMLALDYEDEAAKLAAMDETFKEGGLIHARAGEQAVTRTTVVSEFAAHDAAKRSDGTVTKTWKTTSKKPRASHKSMSGESVGVEEAFSNGMMYPGDWAGGFDEVANCKCMTSYSKEND